MGQTSLTPNCCEQIMGKLDTNFSEDVHKAYAGNKAAIRRTRKKLLEIAKLAKEGRLELSNVNNNLELTKG